MVHLYDYRQIFYRHNFKKRSRPEYLLTLREHMRCRQPINEAHHASLKIFVYKDLRNSIHVFLRHDAIRKPLQPTYDGPFRVVKRIDKTFTIDASTGQKNVSIDSVPISYKTAPTLQHQDQNNLIRINYRHISQHALAALCTFLRNFCSFWGGSVW